MGRVAVRTCDVCGTWDSEDGLVRKVTVCGPRFDLCALCRTERIAQITHDTTAAFEYVRESDTKWLAKGKPDDEPMDLAP